jgi:hypothetical protein
MGVLSDLFVAEPDEVPLVADAGPTTDGRFPATDVKGLDQIKLGALGQLVLDGAFEAGDEGSYGKTYDALVDEMSEPVHELGEEGPWVYPIPERFRSALADLADEDLPELAKAWSEAEEFEADNLGTEDALDYLRELKAIAGKAREPKQLFLWMSL